MALTQGVPFVLAMRRPGPRDSWPCRTRRQGGAIVLACGAVQLGRGFLSPSAASAPAPGPEAIPRQSLAGLGVGAGASRGLGAVGSASKSIGLGAVGLLVGSGSALLARRRSSLARRRASSIGGPGDIEDAVPFQIRGFSLASTFVIAGIALIIFSFVDYFVFGTSGGFGIGGLTFIYAVPVLLLGAALVYAELQPVPVETAPDAEGLFEEKATPTLRKIITDVTRHRYGDDAHLDSSLKALGLTAAAGRYPQLKKIILSKSKESELEFTMLFESKDVPFTIWSDPMKIVACDRFFGPGIWSEVSKYSSEKRIAALKLTTGAKPDKVEAA